MAKQERPILIVDDEPIARMLLQKLLQQEHRPITASSGPEALAILKQEDVSLLITDQQMPGMKGTELIEQARLLRPHIVCMLMSSYNDTNVFIEALMKSGAVRIIKKPWKAQTLLPDIEACLEQYETLKESQQAIDRLKHATAHLDKTMKNLK